MEHEDDIEGDVEGGVEAPAAPLGGEAPAAAVDMGEPAVDTAPPGPPEDATPAEPAASTSTELGGWDGNLDTIEKAEWYNRLPEADRSSVIAGMRKVFTGWQRAATDRFEAAAAQRREAQTMQEAIREEQANLAQLEDRWIKMVTGEDDPISTRDARIADLEAQLAAAGASAEATEGGASKEDAVIAAKAAYDQRMQEWEAEKQQLLQDRDSAKQELQGYLDQVEAAYQDHVSEWLSERAPDLLAEDADIQPLTRFMQLHAQGIDLDKALAMVRVAHPAPAAPLVPDAISLMHMDGDRSATTQRPATGALDRMKRETTPVAQWRQPN